MSEDTRQRVMFGNALPTTKATLGPLTAVGWGVLLTGIMGAVISLINGGWLAALLLVVAAVVIDVLFIIRWGDLNAGRTIAAMILDRRVNGRRHRQGSTHYRTGPFTELPADALTALPGMLAGVEEISGVDGSGQEYVLLHHQPGTPDAMLAATMICRPNGTSMLPQQQIDQQVSNFGGWIVSLSRDTAIAGAVIVVDAARESIEPLIAKIDAQVDPHAPAVAQAQLREGARALSGQSEDVSVYASVVWSVAALGGDVDDAAADVAAKLPAHRGNLSAGGAGTPVVATSEDLARAVRIAYRPDRAREFGSDDLAGRPFRMKVTEAGPDEFRDDERRICYHDGVASMTVMMTVPPRMHITEDTLNSVFQPNGKFLRKRTAVFYRPLSPGEGIQAAKKLRDGARVAATSKRGEGSEFDSYRTQLARATERNLVTGASMTAFAIEVTVTFEPTPRAIRDATQELKSLLEGVDISYRFIETDTAAAFHSTLPLGVLPWKYATAMQTLTNRSNW